MKNRRNLFVIASMLVLIISSVSFLVFWGCSSGGSGQEKSNPPEKDISLSFNQGNIIKMIEELETTLNNDPNNQEANMRLAILRIPKALFDTLTTITPTAKGTMWAKTIPSELEPCYDALLKGNDLPSHGDDICEYSSVIWDNIFAEDFPQECKEVKLVEWLDYVKDIILPELDGALTNLSKISSGSTFYFGPDSIPPCFDTEGLETTEIDYSDILVARTMLQALKGVLHLLMAYDLDITLAYLMNEELSLTDLLNDHLNLGTLTAEAVTLLPIAKAAISEGLTTAQAAINSLLTENDTQSNDLVIIDSEDASEAGTVLDILSKLAAALNGPTDIPLEGEVALRVDARVLFDGSLDNLRELLPNGFGTEAGECSVYPDPTMGGLFPELNQDDIYFLFECNDNCLFVIDYGRSRECANAISDAIGPLNTCVDECDPMDNYDYCLYGCFGDYNELAEICYFNGTPPDFNSCGYCFEQCSSDFSMCIFSPITPAATCLDSSSECLNECYYSTFYPEVTCQDVLDTMNTQACIDAVSSAIGTLNDCVDYCSDEICIYGCQDDYMDSTSACFPYGKVNNWLYLCGDFGGCLEQCGSNFMACMAGEDTVEFCSIELNDCNSRCPI